MTAERVVPCCGYEYSDDNYPVKWNEWNKVVQCHNCGQTWQPKPRPARPGRERSGDSCKSPAREPSIIVGGGDCVVKHPQPALDPLEVEFQERTSGR